MTEHTNELEILDAILNFDIKDIPENTRFWMVRTQKGYFYNEFIAKKYVALAWNNIDINTDFSEARREALKEDIMIKYPEINRPSTVINKCQNFITEIKAGDILVIPSKSSQYITFAIAGDYYEEASKTVEIEKSVITRIKNNDVDINDVSCPYKKRRHITVLRTVSSDDINIKLYHAISNYHGISNLDSYAYYILNSLYNCYQYKNYVSVVYNIRKTDPIKPRELSGLIYGNTECLCTFTPDEKLSTQVNLHSPGDVIYLLKDAGEWCVNNWKIILGLLVVLGGGSAFSFKISGVVDIVKNIFSIPEELRSQKLDNDVKETEVQLKRLELYQKIKDSGVDPKSLVLPLETLVSSATSLHASPIVLDNSYPVLSTVDEDEESTDIKE